MKIAILTLPLGNNYGGNIQNWALQQVLIRLGHNPETFDCHYGRSSANVFRKILSFFISAYRRYVLNNSNVYVNNPFAQNYIVYEPLTLNRSFRKKINLTKQFAFTDKSWQRCVDLRSYDAFIVGSDQVWRQEYSHNIESFFLDFLQDNDNRLKISYAASFGLTHSDIDTDRIYKCKEYIKRFDAVSVREFTGLNILKQQFQYPNGVKTLDPTLLLKVEDYLEIIKESDHHPGHIAAYILDKNEGKDSILESVKTKFGLQEYKIGIYFKGYHRPTMSEWLAMFADAKYVVTDSFHGCVFSIIFHKPFVAIANKDRGLDRFVSLLEPLGLIDRLVYSINDFTNRKESLLKSIDYTEVDKKLELQRKESMDFLKNALSK